MLLDNDKERDLCISESEYTQKMLLYPQLLGNYIERGVSLRFTLKQWNIIEELLHQENIALQDRCKNCEEVLRDKYNDGISNGDFLGELSQIHLEQLQGRKKEIEKMLKKLESEEL